MPSGTNETTVRTEHEYQGFSEHSTLVFRSAFRGWPYSNLQKKIIEIGTAMFVESSTRVLKRRGHSAIWYLCFERLDVWFFKELVYRACFTLGKTAAHYSWKSFFPLTHTSVRIPLVLTVGFNKPAFQQACLRLNLGLEIIPSRAGSNIPVSTIRYIYQVPYSPKLRLPERIYPYR